MTAQDVARIVAHVAVVQCIADLISRKVVYEKEDYQRSVANVERLRQKRDKIVAGHVPKEGKAGDRAQKKVQRAEDDFNNAIADVSKQHAVPGMLTSLTFLILYRVLQTEYAGKVVCILPFEPFGFVQSWMTLRGISIDKATVIDGVSGNRACGFLLVYMLSTMSVKYILHKSMGVQPPEGCEGVSSMLDNPRAQKMMQQFGIDTEELNDARALAACRT